VTPGDEGAHRGSIACVARVEVVLHHARGRVFEVRQRRLRVHVGGYPAEGARHRAHGLLHDWPEAGSRASGFAPGFGGSGIVIDVSATFARKRKALECYATQFIETTGEATRLNRPTFLASVEARARRWGELVGADYGEALTYAGALSFGGPLDGLFGAKGLGPGGTA